MIDMPGQRDRLAGTDAMLSSNDSLQVDTEIRLKVAPTRSDHLRPWLPLIFAATAYLTLITRIPSLLKDSDTYWHLVVGQWIIDHRAVPHVDLFSFTMPGVPWISSGWLSDVVQISRVDGTSNACRTVGVCCVLPAYGFPAEEIAEHGGHAPGDF
jgi:hypothetical protein